VVVSAATHRLIDGYFHTRALGDVSLKGKPEPVPVWELISRRAARTRLEVEAERGLTPFVGRERELGLLHDAFERARAGHGQIVFVAGEPGIGKSRLLLEFRRRLGGEGTWSSNTHTCGWTSAARIVRRRTASKISPRRCWGSMAAREASPGSTDRR
jgi:AAA ATPase domain